MEVLIIHIMIYNLLLILYINKFKVFLITKIYNTTSFLNQITYCKILLYYHKLIYNFYHYKDKYKFNTRI